MSTVLRPQGPARVALVAMAVLAGCGSPGEAACGPVERAVEPAGFHTVGTAEVDYRFSPPVAGPHAAGSAPDPGVYDEPIPESRQVAAAEVGTVLLQYDASLAPDERRVLAGFAEGATDVIVAPVGRAIDGGRPVALTAWEHRQLCDAVDPATVRAFIRTFAGRGPGEL
ncbi:MAG TPA: DUF3105 domain-containing protein [Acidimicrobiales bacterium]|nr:DUF3105 domain-containing protein [Acidimicrobiales bacterium]HWH33837.1 DUF3105 domain-containing protein [Acidimicrobiales bacterium]